MRRERRQHAHALAIGWHVANFQRAGKQLRDLGHYLSRLEQQQDHEATADHAAAIFEGLERQGKVRIRIVPKRSDDGEDVADR